MKPEQIHIDKIRTTFQKMQDKEDFLKLMNEAKALIYGKNAVPFKMRQFTWYAYPSLGSKSYKEFKIKKKSGSYRYIHSPAIGLKAIQKVLAFILQCVFEPNKAATGFIWNKSIVNNAKIHLGMNYVYNIDLKDFFPSIDQARIWKTLQLKPFNLDRSNAFRRSFLPWNDFLKTFSLTEDEIIFTNENNKITATSNKYSFVIPHGFDPAKEKYALVSERNDLKYIAVPRPIFLVNKVPIYSRLDIAGLIAGICCTEMEVERKDKAGEWKKVKLNVLPQGAPTSPIITNIVCQKLDFLLTGLAKRFGLKYSRYADDITFSSMHNVYQPESEFIKELHRIIREQNFNLNPSKSRLQKNGYRKEVTGLLVNEDVNVQRRYIKQLRMWLYYWETYGYEKASKIFTVHYTADKGHVKKGKPDMENVISGKLNYLMMVKGNDNALFTGLKERFDNLAGRNEPIQQHTLLKEESDVRYHKPIEMVSHLYKFSCDENLKWFTHKADYHVEKINYYENLKIAKKAIYNNNLNIATYKFLENFFVVSNQDNSFSIFYPEFSSKYTFRNPYILNKISNGENPFNIHLDNGEMFVDIINRFKHAIEFRTDNLEYTFSKLFRNFCDQRISIDILIDYTDDFKKNSNSLSTYIDVNNFFRGISVLIQWINDNKALGKLIEIDLKNKNELYEISILQKGSYINKEVNDEKLKGLSGHLETLRKYWFSIVDFRIEAELSDKNTYSIDCLNVKTKMLKNTSKLTENEITRIDTSVDGVKYIISIYKTKAL